MQLIQFHVMFIVGGRGEGGGRGTAIYNEKEGIKRLS